MQQHLSLGNLSAHLPIPNDKPGLGSSNICKHLSELIRLTFSKYDGYFSRDNISAVLISKSLLSLHHLPKCQIPPANKDLRYVYKGQQMLALWPYPRFSCQWSQSGRGTGFCDTRHLCPFQIRHFSHLDHQQRCLRLFWNGHFNDYWGIMILLPYIIAIFRMQQLNFFK